jgi:FdhD protein
MVKKNTCNKRKEEKIASSFCVTNFELHRFFAKQLSINVNAGKFVDDRGKITAKQFGPSSELYANSLVELGRYRVMDQFRVITVTADGIEERDDVLAVEEPLQISIAVDNVARPVAITMRTPGHDSELVAGFLYTEGIIDSIGSIASFEPSGEAVIVHLNAGGSIDWSRLERHSFANSSCGVCGKTTLGNLAAPIPHKLNPTQPVIDRDVIHRLPHILRKAQAGFSRTGGLHASALFSVDGGLIVCREDVGRHNALDKVIGERFIACALPLRDSLLLVSGRLSFELVQKAAMAGIPIIAAVGAPSTAAVDVAREAGITVAGFVRDGRYNVYTGSQRIP